MTVLDLRLTQGLTPSGLPAVRLGEPWLDAYLDFLTALGNSRDGRISTLGEDDSALLLLILLW